jgi:hypothetical protein
MSARTRERFVPRAHKGNAVRVRQSRYLSFSLHRNRQDCVHPAHPARIDAAVGTGMSAMKIDIYELCLGKKQLVDSHLMSRGLYDLCKTPDDDPIFLSNKVIMQSGRQLQHPLLCEECDGALSREGENWVLPLLAKIDGRFPLFDLLQKTPPDVTDGDLRVYAASRIPAIDFRKLTHFAMGIFWKASAHSGWGGKTTPLIRTWKIWGITTCVPTRRSPVP